MPTCPNAPHGCKGDGHMSAEWVRVFGPERPCLACVSPQTVLGSIPRGPADSSSTGSRGAHAEHGGRGSQGPVRGDGSGGDEHEQGDTTDADAEEKTAKDPYSFTDYDS